RKFVTASTNTCRSGNLRKVPKRSRPNNQRKRQLPKRFQQTEAGRTTFATASRTKGRQNHDQSQHHLSRIETPHSHHLFGFSPRSRYSRDTLPGRCRCIRGCPAFPVRGATSA